MLIIPRLHNKGLQICLQMINFAVPTDKKLSKMKKFLSIIFALGCLLAFPAQVQAFSAIEIIEQPTTDDVTISVSGQTLHVTGADGMALQVYNVAGVCVKSFKVEGSDKRYDLNLPKGCYIIKVGKTVRKISIR